MSPIRRGILLRVAYDGTQFHGWAVQKQGERTVAEDLSNALVELDPNASSVRGASRTDAGVHARSQMVAFDPLREINLRGWVLGLNQKLASDVAVQQAFSVERGYDPRFRCMGKTYLYHLTIDFVRSPLERERAWLVTPPFDFELASTEARRAVGTHDFAAFRSASDERKNSVRTLTEVSLVRTGAHSVTIAVRGTAFMHNMVRILVGTIVDVGRARNKPGAIDRALTSLDRRDAGITAPAHGLVLDEIYLPPEDLSDERWP